MSTLRSAFASLHVALAAAVVVGVFAQVYLIGAYVFGAGGDALDAHETVGLITHGLEVLVLVAALAAWLARTDLLLSLSLAIVGTAQVALSEAADWAGGLHALGALVVLVLATLLAQRGLRRRRAATDRVA